MKLPPPGQSGAYRCLVIDPPWDQGKTGKRACRPKQTTTLDYSTMTPQQIFALPVAEWAAPEAGLRLWATSSRSRSTGQPILSLAFDLMAHWDFRCHTLLTWDKGAGPCPFGPCQITA